jgi:hypothetical protein
MDFTSGYILGGITTAALSLVFGYATAGEAGILVLILLAVSLLDYIFSSNRSK